VRHSSGRHSPSERPRRGWFEAVQNARAEIAVRLADSPSLAPQVDSILAEIWPRARRQACDALLVFSKREQVPDVCPYSAEPALDDGFFSGGPGAQR
jgi:hypothetical protein